MSTHTDRILIVYSSTRRVVAADGSNPGGTYVDAALYERHDPDPIGAPLWRYPLPIKVVETIQSGITSRDE